jgi:hypothetical protein
MIVHARELDAVQEPDAEAGVRSETAIIRGGRVFLNPSAIWSGTAVGARADVHDGR